MEVVKEKFDFTVRWEPFLLRPNMPDEGIPKSADYRSKGLGGRLRSVGSEVGIDFTYKAERFPNTLRAHALLEYAKQVDGGSKQNDVAELLFKAYFTDGSLLDQKSLVAIGEQAGLDKGMVKSVVSSEEHVNAANLASRSWKQKGVSGVPYFYMNGQRTFSGAQPPEAFIQTFNMIAEKFPLESGEASAKI